MSLEELRSMCEEIEKEIGVCKQDLRKAGSLMIKTQSFINLLSKEDADNKEIKALRDKAANFQSQAKEFNERRAREKRELEHEMEDSKIRIKKITEISHAEQSTDDFLSTQTNKLDDFITNTMDSLESLRRQSVFISRINETLRRGAIRLGVNRSTLESIESRFSSDRLLFFILLAFVLCLMFILRFLL